jgi:hypothetical protein
LRRFHRNLLWLKGSQWRILILMLTTAPADVVALGTGSYTISDAARLLKISPLNIRRWLGGYTYW